MITLATKPHQSDVRCIGQLVDLLELWTIFFCIADVDLRCLLSVVVLTLVVIDWVACLCVLLS